MALELDLMPLEEKPPEPVAPKTIVVRYGYLKQIGEFVSEMNQKVGCGSKLVCRTERGTEICEMLTTTCSNGGCGKSVTREKMLEYIGNSGGADYPFTSEGRVLRVATPQDLLEQDKLNENRKRDLTLARDLVTRHRLQMKIVEVEYLLGGERVMFYFLSEHRVDFRTLVREMAHELHTRIELRQVGARDEARITADYEKCGQHCCCKQFLKVLTPISMRAAKVQKATLDPAKISGRCGRLMCCLRYEDQTYEELRKKLPRRNTRVKTEQGEAWVIDGQILTQLVMVQYDDGKRAAVAMELITAFDLPKPKMANGQTMQTPNDRMPEPRPMEGGPAGPGGPGVRPGGPGAPGGPMQRRGPGGPPNGPPIQGGPARPVGPGGPGVQQRPGGAGPQGGPGPNAGPKLPPRPPERGMPPKLPPRSGQQQGQNAPQQNRPMPNQTPPPVRDEIDDLMADAMDEGPMAVPQASAEAAAAPMPPVEPEVKPKEGGDEDRPPMIEPEEPRIM